MARTIRHFKTWMEDIKGEANSYRWFPVWIGIGLVLAILLLVSSISTYIMVSRRLLVEHVRGDLAAEMATLDRESRQSKVESTAQLAAMLKRAVERSNGRIEWLRVQSGDGATVVHAGAYVPQTFSMESIQAHLSERQPIFKTVETANGKALAEVFPFRIPGPAGQFDPAKRGRGPHAFGTIEIGAPLAGESASLWPLKRNLMINSSAALVLLISLTVIAVRLRSYVAGQQLHREVEIARHVQMDLLPSPQCKLDGFEVAADFVPAARVSGDFFDTFPVREQRAAFVLGDVAGKGVPAALLMGVLHGAVRSGSWAESGIQHADATEQINALLYERAATARYATMFWSYFDTGTQHLKYINAGHCPPLLMKAGHGNTVLRLTSGGPVLGLLPSASYQQGSVRMDPGDILVLFSDGIAEAHNSRDEEFGEERIIEVARNCFDRRADTVRNAILSAVEAFTGRAIPEDDRTLCVIGYTGLPVAWTADRIEPVREREFASLSA